MGEIFYWIVLGFAYFLSLLMFVIAVWLLAKLFLLSAGVCFVLIFSLLHAGGMVRHDSDGNQFISIISTILALGISVAYLFSKDERNWGDWIIFPILVFFSWMVLYSIGLGLKKIV